MSAYLKRFGDAPFAFMLLQAQLTLGTCLSATAFILFMAPFDVAPTGVTGISFILNHYLGTPIGLLVFILNIPILIASRYFLPGGWKTTMQTLYIVLIYSSVVDLIAPFLPANGVSENPLLSVFFAGVLGGIGHGLILRAGATMGGTSTIARIIQRRTGMPLSSIYLYTDTLVLLGAGLTFGWELAMYAVVVLFVDGMAANYVMEGPAVIRTATIITNEYERVREAILIGLNRGGTSLTGEGLYSHQERSVIFVTINRTQVADLQAVVLEADPKAFIVIGHGHHAVGQGFQRPKLQLTRSIDVDKLST